MNAQRPVTAWLACAFVAWTASAPAYADAPPAMPLAELQARVAQAPHDTDTRFALARAYARAGRTAEASAEFDVLLAQDASNADWLLGKAQTLLASGRPREAAALLERARNVAPDYEDVWRAEVSALAAAGDERAALAVLEDASWRFASADWPRARARELREVRLLRAGTRLSASAGYEELSEGHPSWRSGALALVRGVTPNMQLAMSVAVEQRHDEQDEQFGLSMARRFAGGWALEAGGELAPNGALLPQTQMHLGVHRALSRAWSGGVRYRHASYAALDVDAMSAAAEYAFGVRRLAYTLTATKPSAIGTRFAHTLRFTRDYGRGSSAGLLLARGEEAETVAPERVLVTRNTSVVLLGTHWRSAAWGLSWSCGWNEQGELYERLGVRLGIEHRF